MAHRHVRWGRRLVVAIPLAAALSCDGGSTTEPASVWRRYALSHFNGGLLPVFRGVVGPDSTWIVAETLTFRSDAKAMSAIYYAEGPTSESTSPKVFAALYPYTLFGDSVQVGTQVVCVTLPCPATHRKGTISEWELVLDYEAIQEYRFLRIPPP